MLSNKIHLSFILLFTVITVGFVSCGSKETPEVPKLKEGEIKFEVTYPYYTDGFMASLLPDEMVMTFKDNIYKNSVTKGGLFTTIIISDCNKKELTMMLDFGPKKIYCILDTALTAEMMQRFSVPDIIEANKIDSLAGMKCNKKLAIFDDLEDGYDVELFETNEIDIKNSNWCNQYKEIDGVLLGYEIEQYGLQMRMRAMELDSVKVDSTAFIIPTIYKEVPMDRMLYELEEIFKSLVM